MSTFFVGVDPGASGGIAVVNSEWSASTKMPDTLRDIWDWFRDAKERYNPSLAVIEKVHAMPEQGVSSTFKFGCSYGGLLMALTGIGIPYVEVSPQRWVKELEIPYRAKNESKTQWKNRLKGIAQQRFPNHSPITLATADALLIALVARKRYVEEVGKSG